MGVNIQWDTNQQTILRYEFFGNWTIDEYNTALEVGREYMASVVHKVCIYNDFKQTNHFPPHFIPHARNIINSRPDNTGLAVFVTSSMYFEVLYRILSEIMPTVPTDYILVTSEAEAYRRLDKWLIEQV